MANKRRRGLGRGLDALMTNPDSTEAFEVQEGGSERLLHLDPQKITPNPKQPRHTFNEEGLEELAESIKRDGVQEPVIVRWRNDGYELVSGERRVRAAVMAEVDTIPAVVREVSDTDMLKLGLIENIQREDLNPIDLARAYQQLIEDFGWTQDELAEAIGKKRVSVTNVLRLLNLDERVQEDVSQGKLSLGHAKALLALDSPEQQRAAARKIAAKGLSVRQAEKLASESRPQKGKSPAETKDPNLAKLEDDLRRSLGTKVAVKAQSAQRGKIEIEYFNLDELERILAILRG